MAREKEYWASALLFDLGRLAYTVAQVVELGTTYIPPGDYFYFRDNRGMDWENPFDAYLETDLSHRKRLSRS